MMIDLAGQQFGNYRLVRRLGFGGFASVYLGQHVRIASQQAAIKILHLVDVNSQKFQQEAETTAALVHPHIVRLFDFDIQQGTPFLVMDYAPDGSLLTRHPKGTPIPPPQVVQYVNEIALALQYAHNQHIIHRDIKPENILIGRHGELLLSDFGIAVLSQTGRTTMQEAHGIGGTPYYMAPEMFRGKPEKASDQYSLGVVVYEWLSGKRPFTEGNFIQLGFQHAQEPVPPLREHLPALSARVEAVVMRALAKAPKDRFPSVRAFAQALEEAMRIPSIGTRLLIYRGHGDGYRTGAWSPDGKFFATGGVSGLIQVWDASTGKPVLTCEERECSARVNVLAWSPDCTRLASGSSDKTVQVWEASSGRLLHSYEGHGNWVNALAWSPDGSRLASGSSDKTVQVWEASSGRLLHMYKGHTGGVHALTWSPDGTRLASGSSSGKGGPQDDSVQVWEAGSGRLLHTYRGHGSGVTSLAWSPDGTRLASGSTDDTVQVWQASSGRLLHTYRGYGSDVTSLAWSPDGTRLASGSGPWFDASDKMVQVWEAGSGRLLHTYRGHGDRVGALAWSPDGTRLASGSWDKTVQVWEASSGQPLHTYRGHGNSVRALAWSPDGLRLASGSDDHTVQVWEAGSGQLLYTYQGHEHYVWAVAWSPDGTRLASGSLDKTVQVWEASSGRLLHTYQGHGSGVWAVAWSPDGSQLASGSADCTVQVWQAV
jgi:WD40 repeat protein